MMGPFAYFWREEDSVRNVNSGSFQKGGKTKTKIGLEKKRAESWVGKKGRALYRERKRRWEGGRKTNSKGML